MTDDRLLDGCLICGKALSPSDAECLSAKTSDGATFLAHSRCVEALKLLMKEVRAPPPEQDDSTAGLVYRLYGEGWFFEPKGLREVKEKISQMGYNLRSSAIATALRDYTRKGVFTREGKPRSYTYVQKRPPS